MISRWFFWNEPQTPGERAAAYVVNVLLVIGLVSLVLVWRFAGS